MTDRQFEILDELYFVISYSELSEKLKLEDSILTKGLKELIEMGWVKCFNGNSELERDEISFEDANFKKYNFLATKKGLFAHNSR